MNEFELIAKLTSGLPNTADGLLRGIGDDCAVIAGAGGNDWLVTADALIEGVHFDLAFTDAAALGRKALAVNLSDIAAMGGRPRFFLVSIGLPRDRCGVAEEIYSGLRAEAKIYDCVLIGGDTVASPDRIVMSITVLGETEHGKAILRSGARAGDAVYVTNTIGSSALGLKMLKVVIPAEAGIHLKTFTSKHLSPAPRIAEGLFLSSLGFITSMIDVSDGLAADLGHIADESGVGFEIDAAKIPCDEGFAEAAARLGLDPVRLMMTGGEDYELLFTLPENKIGEFEDARRSSQNKFRFTRVGSMAGDKALRIVRDMNGEPVKFSIKGFDHFA